MNAVGYDRDFSLRPSGRARRIKLTVRAVSGWRQVEFDEQARPPPVPPGVRLDLGATAKAWAADRSAARIAAALGCGVLVSLGGDIAVSGHPPACPGWRIRVQDISGRPDDPPPPGPSAVVAIHAGGLATSSTAARRWRRGGDVLHHILDPRTGLPAAAGLAHGFRRRRTARQTGVAGRPVRGVENVVKHVAAAPPAPCRGARGGQAAGLDGDDRGRPGRRRVIGTAAADVLHTDPPAAGRRGRSPRCPRPG